MMRLCFTNIILCTILFFSSKFYSQDTIVRVACVGNSITQGFGSMDARSYPQQLGKLLGSHYIVKNYGIGGRTLLRKGDFPYWDEETFLTAKDFIPHILILSLGTNDSKPQNWIYKNEFYNDYVDMVNEFKAVNPNMQVYVCFPPPVHKDGYGITGTIVENEIIPLIDSVKRTLNTCLMDYFNPMVDKASWFSDGIHPNEDGYKFMAQVAYTTIQNSPSGLIRYFVPKKNTFEKDESVTLYWETSEGSQVTLNGTNVNEKDSMVVNPTGTTTYNLITSGEYPDTASITVEYITPGSIKSLNVIPEYLDLGSSDSSLISWSTSNGSIVTLNGVHVNQTDSMIVVPETTTTYELIASGGNVDTAYITVFVLESERINRAYKQSIKASNTERGYLPESAVDGNPETLWISTESRAQWLSIDLKKNFEINKVVLNWGDNHATSYRVEAIDDLGKSYVLFTNSSGDGGIDSTTGLSGKANYVRLLCLNKTNAAAGYSLKEFELYGKPLVTDVADNQSFPSEFRLNQNYPNPFNPSTIINYEIPEAGNVQIKIYNMLGEAISTLLNNFEQAGKHEISFNGNQLASGVYICKLAFDNKFKVQKIVLAK